MLVLLPNGELHKVESIVPNPDGVTAESIIKDRAPARVLPIKKTRSLEEAKKIVEQCAQLAEQGKVIRVAELTNVDHREDEQHVDSLYVDLGENGGA